MFEEEGVCSRKRRRCVLGVGGGMFSEEVVCSRGMRCGVLRGGLVF